MLRGVRRRRRRGRPAGRQHRPRRRQRAARRPDGRAVDAPARRRSAPVDAGALQVTARRRRHAGPLARATPGRPGSTLRSTSPAATRRPIGGAIATNAGGSRVVRFGTMRSQVAGADGGARRRLARSARWPGCRRRRSACTGRRCWPAARARSASSPAARLRLVPWYRHTATAMVATASLDDAVAVLAALRAGVPHLDAVELILPEAMAVVAAHLGAAPPVGDDGGGRLRRRRVRRPRRPDRRADRPRSAGRPEVLDAAVTTEGPARDRLVAFRDRITESISAHGVPLKLDVAVPVGAPRRADGRRARGRRRATAAGSCRSVTSPRATSTSTCSTPGDPEAITAEVLGARRRSAARSPPSTASASPRRRGCTSCARPAELAAAAAVKRALDPPAMLNPGVLDARCPELADPTRRVRCRSRSRGRGR